MEAYKGHRDTDRPTPFHTRVPCTIKIHAALSFFSEYLVYVQARFLACGCGAKYPNDRDLGQRFSAEWAIATIQRTWIRQIVVNVGHPD